MLKIVLLLFLVIYCPAGAFLATDAQNADDVKYLHLLLSDEKTERIRLQNQVNEMASMLQTLQEQMETNKNCGKLYCPLFRYK